MRDPPTGEQEARDGKEVFHRPGGTVDDANRTEEQERSAEQNHEPTGAKVTRTRLLVRGATAFGQIVERRDVGLATITATATEPYFDHTFAT